MEKTRSRDGTSIAFDRSGEGPPVIVVGGATCDRAMTRPLAEELAKHFTVINYDRRGRGDSGDVAPYAVEREVEDIGALIAEAGGTASVYGHSSGAGLALHAAAQGLPITRLVLHEPPYVPDVEEERRISQEYGENLAVILAEGRRGDAVELFMTTVGMPAEMVDQMRNAPMWAGMEAIAPTLAYDSEVMGDISRGGTIPTDLLGAVSIPALVLSGGASPDWMVDIGRRIADGMPKGRHRVLEGQEHVVPPEILVPVLAEFFDGMIETSYTIEPIGVIRSELDSREAAPLQGYEGAPEAWLDLTAPVEQGLVGITAGDELIVLTWLHHARRDVLLVHPRGRLEAPLTGVFATRSPDRPNPVGLHRVSVLEVAGQRLRVAPLEAIDGTPVVDIKPVLAPSQDR